MRYGGGIQLRTHAWKWGRTNEWVAGARLLVAGCRLPVCLALRPRMPHFIANYGWAFVCGSRWYTIRIYTSIQLQQLYVRHGYVNVVFGKVPIWVYLNEMLSKMKQICYWNFEYEFVVLFLGSGTSVRAVEYDGEAGTGLINTIWDQPEWKTKFTLIPENSEIIYSLSKEGQLRLQSIPSIQPKNTFFAFISFVYLHKKITTKWV